MNSLEKREGDRNLIDAAPSLGDVIQGKLWSNNVKIVGIQKIGKLLSLDVIDIKTSQKDVGVLIDPVEVTIIKDTRLNREYWHWAIEAWRIQYYDVNEEQVAPVISNINIEPFQIEAVYEYIMKPGPVRYLIAHDPGAGKTIIAGMVFKELEAREPPFKRVLFLVPPGLVAKWQLEMTRKFYDRSFQILDKVQWDALSAQLKNPWEEFNRIIMSPYFAYNKKDNLPENINWDLVLIDEAHKFKNPEGKISQSLIADISRRSRHLLLLTATPHDGDNEHFLTIIRYLIPNFSLDSGKNEALGSLMIRRRKEELFHADGSPVFLPRVVMTIAEPLTLPEDIIYKRILQFIERVFQENRAKHLIQIVYQRRFSSSLRALRATLENRLSYKKTGEYKKKVEDSEEEPEDDEINEMEREIIEAKTAVRNFFDTLEEQEITDLLEKIQSTSEKDTRKWKILQDALKNQIQGFSEGPRKAKEKKTKLLIFTEYRDTLEWLVDELRLGGWAVTYIHGGMPMGSVVDHEEKLRANPFNNGTPPNRLISMEWFKTDASIMVATDAAGEGIDLEFCNYMINWDIPWNPNRLEQRMGRIHRYGQKEIAHVFNYTLEDTIEGKVQGAILKKLEQIRDDFEKVEKGSGDRVYDVISEVIRQNDVIEALKTLVEKSEAEQKVYLQILGENIQRKYKSFMSQANYKIQSTKLRECLGIKNKIDNEDVSWEDRLRKARRNIPQYLRDFFLAAWQVLGGKCERENVAESKSNDSMEIFRINHPEPHLFADLIKFPARVSFKSMKEHPEDISIIQYGHPLFERLIKQFRELYGDLLQKGEVLLDPHSDGVYVLYFYLVSFYNKMRRPVLEQVVLLKQEIGKEEILREFFTRSHLGLVVAPDNVKEVCEPYWSSYNKQEFIERWLSNEGLNEIINPIMNELKIVYGPRLKRLKESVPEYNREFYLRTRTLPLEMRQKEKQLLDDKLKEIHELIEQYESELIVGPRTPRFISKALVLPGKINSDGKVEIIPNFKECLEQKTSIPDTSDGCPLKPGEIDRRGIERVIQYEKEMGREARIVDQHRGLGFDVASYQDGKLVRTIEVKSHYDSGDFHLELYEKNHAERENEHAWIYIVENCKADTISERNIYQIFNIAQKYKFEGYEYTTIRFPISLSSWKSLIEPNNS